MHHNMQRKGALGPTLHSFLHTTLPPRPRPKINIPLPSEADLSALFLPTSAASSFPVSPLDKQPSPTTIKVFASCLFSPARSSLSRLSSLALFSPFFFSFLKRKKKPCPRHPHRAFEFSFESAVRLPGGAHAPVAAMTSPVAAAAVVAAVVARGEVGGLTAAGTAAAMGMGEEMGFGAVGSPGFVSLAALPRAQGPDAGVAAGALRASPAPLVGGLYGQTYLVGQGRTHFDPSARMESW